MLPDATPTESPSPSATISGQSGGAPGEDENTSTPEPEGTPGATGTPVTGLLQQYTDPAPWRRPIAVRSGIGVVPQLGSLLSLGMALFPNTAAAQPDSTAVVTTPSSVPAETVEIPTAQPVVFTPTPESPAQADTDARITYARPCRGARAAY